MQAVHSDHFNTQNYLDSLPNDLFGNSIFDDNSSDEFEGFNNANDVYLNCAWESEHSSADNDVELNEFFSRIPANSKEGEDYNDVNINDHMFSLSDNIFSDYFLSIANEDSFPGLLSPNALANAILENGDDLEIESISRPESLFSFDLSTLSTESTNSSNKLNNDCSDSSALPSCSSSECDGKPDISELTSGISQENVKTNSFLHLRDFTTFPFIQGADLFFQNTLIV